MDVMQPKVVQELSLPERYKASMILSAIGDAMGYQEGHWEFTKNGRIIHDTADKMGGIMNLNIEPDCFPVSDDTVMHLATAEALVSKWDQDKNDTHEQQFQKLYKEICEEYVECWKDMDGRSPGIQCANAMPWLKKGAWDKVTYSNGGGGCGAAMRTMVIGLWYPKPEQINDLIAVSIESSRMTHTHPTGFMGGVVAALFTSYAIQNIPIEQWGYLFMHNVYDKCVEYCQKSGRDVAKYTENNSFDYFKNAWVNYLKSRNLSEGDKKPTFPEAYGIEERDAFYKQISFSGWGGSSGHDSVIISYDALLGSNGSWEEFCKRGVLHGGDNDSTGAIGGAWFGAVYGFEGVPKNHWENIEKKQQLESLATRIYERAHLTDVALEQSRA